MVKREPIVNIEKKEHLDIIWKQVPKLSVIDIPNRAEANRLDLVHQELPGFPVWAGVEMPIAGESFNRFGSRER